VTSHPTGGSGSPATGRAGGLGGLIGDWIGARLQPCLPETDLWLLLGGLAAGLGFLYAVQALA
jgi:hypothetical protein